MLSSLQSEKNVLVPRLSYLSRRHVSISAHTDPSPLYFRRGPGGLTFFKITNFICSGLTEGKAPRERDKEKEREEMSLCHTQGDVWEENMTYHNASLSVVYQM